MNEELQLKEIEKVALESIDKASESFEINELRSLYMGKKSPLSNVLKTLGQMDPEMRKTIGSKANEVKMHIEQALKDKLSKIEQAIINMKLASETIDVSLPGVKFNAGSMHPLTKTIEEIEDIFIGMGYTIGEGPEIEIDKFNFEMLNVPAGHPARDMQDSFYVTDNILLRTQTSPIQVRTMLKSGGKPVKVLAPGKVYRRDDDDATHSHQFMQFEGLVVDKNVTMSDLKGTLKLFAQKMFGDQRKIRFKPSYFPFTEPSVEVDVSCFKCGGKGCSMCKQTGWIELLGGGMVHPNVLKGAGYDPEKYQGFAFGIGIERAVMLRHGIDDIRNLYLNDQRFLNQFKGE